MNYKKYILNKYTITKLIDCHLAQLLCIQIGNKTKDFQIVIDATTIDIKLYKEVLENTLLIGHNIKFDLKFLYNYNIIPRKVYDTMIVEQLLFLGYPKGIKKYSLAAVANERLGVDIDKSIRGQIIWRGLDETTIEYSANDVKYLEDIMISQKEDYTKYGMTKGAILECNAVPSIAYLEWCGIKLDENKWKTKMEKDLINLNKSIEELNKFILSLPSSNTIKIKVTVKTRRVVVPIYTIDKQLDLFNGFNTDPVFNINWASSEHVIAVAKFLGFDTQVKDKKTGEDKDSVMEKHLSNQKGINDEFLKLYFNYAGYAKVVSSFGQGHLNSINPVTGRLHTEYHQLGASSSRISSGSKNENTDLQKYKKLPKGSCKYPNIQQLPADEATRSSFVSEKGYKFVSADFSAEELAKVLYIYKFII